MIQHTIQQQKIGLGILAAATLLGAGITVRTAVAREQTAPTKDPVAMGAGAAAELVILMDQDKNGRVSKAEFMNFMAAEFERLDQDKSGELDVQELRQSQLRASHSETFAVAGK
jgi:hypothetical protein